MTRPGGAPYLFVYGTLRREADHPMARLLAASSDHIGVARFQGRLFRVSWYPCVVPSDDERDRVLGDVFEIHADAADSLFNTLDEYEGTKTDGSHPPYYRRERRPVTFDDGRTVVAWIYLFNRPTDRLERIESGDFLSP